MLIFATCPNYLEHAVLLTLIITDITHLEITKLNIYKQTVTVSTNILGGN